MKITEKIHLLKIDFTITISKQVKIPRFVNVLLIFDKQITLVDTGVKGSEKFIYEYIKSQGRQIEDISTIILSHSHPDHIGSAFAIMEKTGCKVYCHDSEKNWIENIELQNSERPVPGFFNLVDKSCPIDFTIKNNQVLNFGDSLKLKCIHTPGHSKGSISLLFNEENVLFTGDTIPLENDIPNYDNHVKLLKSLDTIEQYIDENIILTSWTPALIEKKEKSEKILEGRKYIDKIHNLAKEIYSKQTADNLENCRRVLEKLGLPAFLATPLVNKTLLGHLK